MGAIYVTMFFNFCVPAKEIGKDHNLVERPVCKVLPVGWASSAGIT